MLTISWKLPPGASLQANDESRRLLFVRAVSSPGFLQSISHNVYNPGSAYPTQDQGMRSAFIPVTFRAYAVDAQSAAAGKSVQQLETALQQRNHRLFVERIRRKDKQLVEAAPDYIINAGDEIVLKSEAATNQHNQAIAMLLKSYGYMYDDPLYACDFYTKQCSYGVNTRDLGIMAGTLASGGVNPLPKKD